jgi:hypothetical protein
MVVAVRVRVCPIVIPRSIWDQTKVWHRKAKHGVRVPLPEHVGHSLL